MSSLNEDAILIMLLLIWKVFMNQVLLWSEHVCSGINEFIEYLNSPEQQLSGKDFKMDSKMLTQLFYSFV